MRPDGRLCCPCSFVYIFGFGIFTLIFICFVVVIVILKERSDLNCLAGVPLPACLDYALPQSTAENAGRDGRLCCSCSFVYIFRDRMIFCYSTEKKTKKKRKSRTSLFEFWNFQVDFHFVLLL